MAGRTPAGGSQGAGPGSGCGGARSDGGAPPLAGLAATLWWPSVSLIALLADSATDILLVVDYWRRDYLYWSLGTFLLILVPTILIQLFSMRWFIMDEVASVWHWISHFCLLGLVHRYTVIMKTGFKLMESKSQSDLMKLYIQQSDICMLHLFESFLEAAPQLILQLYIMITLRDWHIFTGISAIASLCSLSWAIVNYLRVLRRARPEKACVRSPGIILQVIWRASLLISRISALLLFAIGFQHWIFVLLGVHWLIMTMWVIHQKTDFCPSRPEEIFYNCIVGVIYCFCFFNLKEGQARYRMFTFYVFMISQNIVCLFLFIFLSEIQDMKHELILIATSLVVGGTIIGIFSMIIFYRWFHPAGPIKWIESKVESNTANVESQVPNNHKPNNSNPPCNPPDDAKNFTMRSLKKPWLEASKSESVSLEGSPQLEVDCTDKKLLLEHWIARAGSPTFASAPIDKNDIIDTTGVEFYSVVNTPEKLSKSSLDKSGIANTSFQLGNDLEDKSKLDKKERIVKINLKNKRKGICSPIELKMNISDIEKEKPIITHSSNVLDMTSQKRRGICSSSQLEEDIDSISLKDNAHVDIVDNFNPVCEISKESLEQHCASNEKTSTGSINNELNLSFSDINSSDINEFNENIVQKLCLSTLKNIKNVHQDADIQNIQRIALEILRDLYNKRGLKDDQDIESEFSSSLGRDLDTPSEVLSTHDYENICAVNIAREAWGLRSWKACADMEASPPPPPPLPARRHQLINNDHSQYVNTIAYELARCEENNCALSDPPICEKETDSSVFIAKPYVIDQNGGMFPLTTSLEPILEEIDEFMDISNATMKRQRRCSESALVATIDEIRHDTVTNSPRNVYHRMDWDSPHLNSIKDKCVRSEQTRSNLKKELWSDRPPIYNNNINNHIIRDLTEQSPQHLTSLNVPFSFKDTNLACKNSSFLANKTNESIHENYKYIKNSETVQNVERFKKKLYTPKSQNFIKEDLKFPKSKTVNEHNQGHNLSYEEIMFLSQLVNENNSNLTKKQINHSSNEDISNFHISSSLQLLIDQDCHTNGSKTLDTRSNCKRSGNKPRRKFSLLREKFEPKSRHSDEEMLFQSLESVKSMSQNNLEITPSQNLVKDNSNFALVNNQENRIAKDKENVTPVEKVDTKINSITSIAESVHISPPRDTTRSSDAVSNLKEKRSIFLKQVLSPPKINTWNKK